MTNYYVNTRAQYNGDHEVHTDSCDRLPDIENRKFLGTFFNCQDAVREAKKTYSNADGCHYCCKECNNS